MSEAAQTLDGWYSLHDLRAMNWTAWKELSSDERQAAIQEFHQFLNKLNETQEKKEGSHALYTSSGKKLILSFGCFAQQWKS